MRKIKLFLLILTAFILAHSCGYLLEEPAREPTLEQKSRGIWIVGGQNSNNIATGTSSAIAGIDLYDPVRNLWYHDVASLLVPVSFAGTASCGGKIYVIGGFNASGNPVSTVQVYDVAANTITYGADIYIGVTYYPKANIEAAAVGSKIYFVGGTITAYSAWTAPVTNQVFEYDTVSNLWALKTPTLATNRANMNIFVNDDIVTFLGGRSAVATPSNVNEGYIVSQNLATGYTETTTPATTRAGFAGAMHVPDSGPVRIMLIGGATTFTNVTGSFVFYDDNPASVAVNMVSTAVYLNNPFTAPAAWTAAANPYPNSVGFASAAMYGSKIYCFGGVNTFTAGSNPAIYTDVYCLDMTNLPAGNWEERADMPVARFGHSAITVRP